MRVPVASLICCAEMPVQRIHAVNVRARASIGAILSIASSALLISCDFGNPLPYTYMMQSRISAPASSIPATMR